MGWEYDVRKHTFTRNGESYKADYAGTSRNHPLDSSEGCIIAPLSVRKSIWTSGDRELIVK